MSAALDIQHAICTHINQEWENIKSVIIESAEETTKIREKNIRNEWWDEECKAAISRKNNARRKCLQKRTI